MPYLQRRVQHPGRLRGRDNTGRRRPRNKGGTKNSTTTGEMAICLGPAANGTPVLRRQVVSSLKPGDDEIHYSDGSHRWMCPDPDDAAQEKWRTRLDAHIEAHRDLGNPGRSPGRGLGPGKPLADR